MMKAVATKAKIHTETSPAQAFSTFGIGFEWFERMNECCPTQLLQLKRSRDLVAQERVGAIRQIKTDQFVKNK